MEELYFDKLGNFTEKDCKNIKNMMDGSTFYNYSVGWSNWASNCSLIVKADCSEEDKERAKKCSFMRPSEKVHQHSTWQISSSATEMPI